ncbi:MAG: DUF1674 domain-containing protein [Rhodobacteraceae bacterium]|nr:DUF1674 domain-containing protein [Paracoccaceae bacterium]
MPDTDPQSADTTANAAPQETEDERRAKLPPAAQRALAEAEARRAAAPDPARPVELGGRKGPEPVRYGDWEKKGIAVDF